MLRVADGAVMVRRGSRTSLFCDDRLVLAVYSYSTFSQDIDALG